MKKIFSSPYSWVIVLGILALINWLGSSLHTRLDLTSEKRYTLSPATRQLLKELDEPATFTVLMDGDLPAGFKKLAGSTRDMLQEFKEINSSNIRYHFSLPGAGVPDSLKAQMPDSLRSLGISATNVRAQAKRGEGEEQRLVYPGVILEYKDRVMGVDLLQGQSAVDGINSLNNAEALLEYKLSSGIEKIKQDSVPVIAYLTGNGQPQSLEVYDLIQNTLKQEYGFSILPVDSVATIPSFFNALMIVKPRTAFTEAQKLKIDQYVMHGGKVIWMLDRLYASLDSLQRSEGSFVAFDMGLNLDDLLFKYGVRVNPDLLQDLNAAQIPLVVGQLGNKPQMEMLPWPYFPLLADPGNGNPISKNLDYVYSQFPQSLDTVKAEGIAKTVLLASSPNARILSTPVRVIWNSVSTEADVRSFTASHVPVAMLLEGQFNSLYANRISRAGMDSLANLYKKPFQASGEAGGKMIVVSDGDIVLNAVSKEKGPLQMGEDQFTGYQYANKSFIQNCLEYMVGNAGILQTRAKDYTLRLLDKKKVEEEKSKWQLLNILTPVLLIGLFAIFYTAFIRKKYR